MLLTLPVGGIYGKRKIFPPVFTNKGHNFNINLSISADNEHIGTALLTLVYWDNGEKFVVHDYVAGSASTSFNICINNPTSLPPYILYIENVGIGVIPINIVCSYELIAGFYEPYDDEILDNNIVKNPVITLYDICPFPPREETICSIKERWDVGQCTRSPLVLDLDENGINTLPTSAGVFFDHDANGFAENTAWVGQGDGILVRDLNNNGRIDNGSELFGNNTVLPDGTKAANGFEALRALDSNNDGLFNAEDTAWNEVKIWQDGNSDGKTDDGEIKSLDGAGVSSINLNDTEQDITDENGNRHKQTSVFINKEGAANTISDIWFAVNTTNTIDLSDVTISESISELPDIEGSGNVHSLHIAMALDTSGQLQQAVTNFINEQQSQNRRDMINEIVYRWTGVYDMDQDGRNPSHTYGNVLGDCRKLEALERFLGTEYRGIWCDETYDRNPHGQAAPYILEAFELLADFVWYRLSAQSTYKELLSKVLLYWNNSEQKWQIDVSVAVELLRAQYIANQSATSENMTNLAEYLAMSKLETADEIIAAFAAQGNPEGDLFERELATFGTKIGGNDGNDIFNGTEKSDFFNGKGGNDRIWTWGGNDFLIGGRGDDILSGGEGSDTYYWNWGDGFDEIHDGSTISSDVNKVVFGEGITFDDLAFARDGNDLIVHVKGDQTQGFRIFYQFYSSDYGIDFFIFADGTSVNLRNTGFTFNQENGASYAEGTPYDDIMHGTSGNNDLNGHEGNDVLYGYDGNDRLTGEGGNDFLIGGHGDDILSGGEGSDTYYWNWGDGFDEIHDGSTTSSDVNKVVFGEGITFDDLAFARDGNDLIVHVKGDQTQGFRIFYQFYSSDYGIDFFVFADGTSVNLRNFNFNFSSPAA